MGHPEVEAAKKVYFARSVVVKGCDEAKHRVKAQGTQGKKGLFVPI